MPTDALDLEWYRRCANEADLCDHLGLRNCLTAVLDEHEALISRLRRAERDLRRERQRWEDRATAQGYAEQRAERAERVVEEARKFLYGSKALTGAHRYRLQDALDSLDREEERGGFRLLKGSVDFEYDPEDQPSGTLVDDDQALDQEEE